MHFHGLVRGRVLAPARFILYGLLLLVSCQVLYAQDTVTSLPGADSVFEDGKYLLAPGDVISVTVFGEPDISDESVRIPISGVYNYPLLGEISLDNETVGSLADKFESRLKAGFLSDPKVSVNIVSYRPVIVTGIVGNAGTIEYQEGMTVRVLSALAQVNLKSVDLSDIEIQRGTDVFSPDSFETLVLPGDIVAYESGLPMSDYYYIYGEVNRSGRYEYEKNLTFEKAIIVAGGYNPFASKSSVTVRRAGEEKTQKFKLHEQVEPGDVIIIKKRWF